MAINIEAGSTDQSIDVFLQDSSSSTGAGLTGLLYNSAGLTCYYREGATGTSTQLTLATQTVGGAHSDGGFVEVDSTNMPGVYRLDLSDTMVSDEGYNTIYLQGATNLLATAIRINLNPVPSDVVKVDGNATAADNLEFQYDGTTGLSGDTFPATQLQVGGIATGAGGISAVADSFTLTTGTESAGTVTTTEAKDGVVHTITPSASAIDCYYEFDIGVNGKATEVIWDGYVGNNADNVEVYGYDWVSASFKQVGTIAGKNANTVEEQIFIFTNAMTGTGANAGKVRCQFKSDGADVAVDFNTDRILCEYTSVATESLILHSGVAQAGASNTITLDSGASSINDFYNHAVVVITSGTAVEQERIIVDYNGTTKVATIAPPWVTTPDSTSAFDVLPGTVHAETGWATIKVGLAQAAAANTITLASGASAVDDYYDGDIIKIDSGTGEGQVRVIRGYNGTTKVATIDPPWDTTPDTTSEYIVEDAHPYLISLVSHGGTAQAGGANTITLDANASATDQFYKHERIEIVGGTGDGQQAIIVNYNGTTKVATVAPAWETNPDATSRFQISPAICHAETTFQTIKVGMAAAGTSTTITLDSLASATDDFYNGEIIVIDKGTGAGQRRMISDYNGTTKVATVSVAWGTTPDTTSEYIVSVGHPWSPEWDTAAADAVWDDTATRNVASSPGKRLRQLEEGVISAESSVNDVSASTTSFVTNLSSAVDDFYNDKILVFTDGALAGQSRVITDYNGTTKAVTFDEATTSAPADATQFIILAMHQHSIAQIQSGLATSAALATVDSNVDAILVDTGTTLPATLTTIEGKVDTVDTVVDAVKVKTDLIPADFTNEWNNVYDVQVTGITTTVETAAGKHSVAGTVMMSTNAALAGGVLTAKKPSDDTTFQTYTITTSASADNITGVS